MALSTARAANLPPPDRTGTLVVTLTFDAAGKYTNARNGAYSNLKFRRTLTYTMPLGGTYSVGPAFKEVEQREPLGGFTVPNFKRFLNLHPRDLLGATGRACGTGKTEFLDEAEGMKVGDPGQPPLVPFTHVNRGGGAFPSGDKTVPERDLCQTVISVDTEKKVFHLRLDGSDSNVKIRSLHNGHEAAPYNLPLQGYDSNGAAKAKLTFLDLPLPANAGSTGIIEGTRVIEAFNTVSGPDRSTFPLRATVKWHLTVK
jgi:hypothetical protein